MKTINWKTVDISKSFDEQDFDKDAPQNVEQYMLRLMIFEDFLRKSTEAFHNSGFDQEVISEWLYEMEEWEIGFLGDRKGFYDGGYKQQELYFALKSLSKEGYDMASHWKMFKTLMSSIWKQLPDYYKGVNQISGEEKVEKPEDYDPDKPFPQYPIPEDIDE